VDKPVKEGRDLRGESGKVDRNTPVSPTACKYNYNLLKDYGQTGYVWMLELMNLFVTKGNVYIFVTK
jgi:hypothetical protein